MSSLQPPSDTPRPARRRRSSSTLALNSVPNIAGKYVNSPATQEGILSQAAVAPPKAQIPPAARRTKAVRHEGTWDIPVLNWLAEPGSTFLVLANALIVYLGFRIFLPQYSNPIEPFILVSYPIASRPGYYTKGWLDAAFLTFYIVFWFWVRQSLAIYVFPYVARKLGVQRKVKVERFVEQAYTCCYATCSTAAGVLVMKALPSWWYYTPAFFEDYQNHFQMQGQLKAYYLVQSAFWLQQILILVLRMEKPRDDFAELAFHHAVTFYLIFCSYLMNYTIIGNSIFLSMDISDAFLAFAKCINYTDPPEWISSCAFSLFVLVWTYFRHYLNLKILVNLFADVGRVAARYRVWAPERELFIPPGFVYMIFAPIALLQMVNLFWYYRIWVILIKAIRGVHLADDREDGEDKDD